MLADLVGLQSAHLLGVPAHVFAFGCVVRMRAASSPAEATKS